MNLQMGLYLEQEERLPKTGRHILAQYDDDSILVYQAYNVSIGRFAAERGYFGGKFRYERMSWIKPNFLWMMYRSGWGTKPDQEVTLAVRLKRDFFERLLKNSVPSSYKPDLYTTKKEWENAVTVSNVRSQWDPDHAPSGAPLERRAIQLGLRGETLVEYGREAILEIEDISACVAEQRANRSDHSKLHVPRERVFLPKEVEIVAHLKIGDFA